MNVFPAEVMPADLLQIAETVTRDAMDAGLNPTDILAQLNLHPGDFHLSGSSKDIWHQLLKAVHAGRSRQAGFRADGVAALLEMVAERIPGNAHLLQLANDMGKVAAQRQVGQRGLFISYARKDIADVNLLYDALRQRNPGWDIFKDDRSIPPGSNWLDLIRERAGSASVMVCWLTPYYLKSAFCNYELGIAQARGAKVVPILKDVSVVTHAPAYLGNLQSIPFSNHTDLAAQVTGLLS